ncbi:MAG: hypothetical protein JOY71_08600 [Acetobacteraceae bacterium]|nr:hypothetical protein [Acetobacteraceae bacterium]
MSIVNTLSSGLYAAALLARGRPEALRYVEVDLDGAARSFWAAALCLPASICLRLIDWTIGPAPANPAHDFALDLLSYVIGWAGYAVLCRPFVAAMGRGKLWPRYIAAWNWCNVAQYMLWVAASIPTLLGAPLWLAQTAQLVALGWALWLEWFTARVALFIPMLPAAGLVLLDVLLGLALARLGG